MGSIKWYFLIYIWLTLWYQQTLEKNSILSHHLKMPGTQKDLNIPNHSSGSPWGSQNSKTGRHCSVGCQHLFCSLKLLAYSLHRLVSILSIVIFDLLISLVPKILLHLLHDQRPDKRSAQDDKTLWYQTHFSLISTSWSHSKHWAQNLLSSLLSALK